MTRVVFMVIWLLGLSPLAAQADSSRITRLLTDYRIRATVGLQFWTTYSPNVEVYDPERRDFLAVDPRVNAQLRRSRFTLTGQPYRRLRFNLVTALDQLGHDGLAATQAGNGGGTPSFRLWNAWLQWQLLRNSDRLYLVTGYFLPVIGRESATPALRSTSFEKAWSQFYLRRHLTGPGSGRATGLLLAGQHHGADNRWHLTYEAAWQNALPLAYDGTSAGDRYAPLLSGRLSVQWGDAEAATYTLPRRVNYFGERRGGTLSLTGARQGRSDQFLANRAYGFEWLGNYGAWQVDGEYLWLERRGETRAGTMTVRSRTGYLRASHNWSLPASRTLQPTISYWWFRGPTDYEEALLAQELATFTGADSGLDLGANFYLNPDVKFSLFYAHRRGGSVEGQPATTNNAYFQQAGVGVVRRGSYVGAGLTVWL